MSDITEFLLARIAEDEATALAAGDSGPHWGAMTEETGDGENIYYTVELTSAPHTTIADMESTQPIGRAQSEHIARHDPARVLAECAVKRAIIEAFNPNAPDLDPYVGRDVLILLAVAYQAHPDYSPDWK